MTSNDSDTIAIDAIVSLLVKCQGRHFGDGEVASLCAKIQALRSELGSHAGLVGAALLIREGKADVTISLLDRLARGESLVANKADTSVLDRVGRVDRGENAVIPIAVPPCLRDRRAGRRRQAVSAQHRAV